MSNVWGLISADVDHLHDDSDGRCTEKVSLRFLRRNDGTVFTISVHKNADDISDGDVLEALKASLNYALIANNLPLLDGATVATAPDEPTGNVPRTVLDS
jgi:hypothetical protein